MYFSGQVDLPTEDNCDFITSCLNNSIKRLSKTVQFNLVKNIDDVNGNVPDIYISSEKTFKNILCARIFVADISIINPYKRFRKCPNPNVLLNLGYAINTLGWDRLICICNTDSGKIENLPYELRNREIFEYSLKNKNKNYVKTKLTKQITNHIMSLYENEKLFDTIDDNLKSKSDKLICIFTCYIDYLLFGLNDNIIYDKLRNLLNMTEVEIEMALYNRKYIMLDLMSILLCFDSIFSSHASYVLNRSDNYETTIKLQSIASQVQSLRFFFIPRRYLNISRKFNLGYNIGSKTLDDHYNSINEINKLYNKAKDISCFNYPTDKQIVMLARYSRNGYHNSDTFMDDDVREFVKIIRQIIDSFDSWLDFCNRELLLDIDKKVIINKTYNVPDWCI